MCGIYAFCICGIHSVKDDALLGDGNEGLHKQRIQTRTGQLYLPVQGRFGIKVQFVHKLLNNFTVQVSLGSTFYNIASF